MASLSIEMKAAPFILEVNMKEDIISPVELRIGNHLEYKGQLVHVTSLSLDIDDEYQETIGFCKHGEWTKEHADWNRALYNKLKRIPLTEEWLLKFGFEKISNGFYRRSTVALRFGPNGYEVMDGYSSAFFVLRYVHQLQNLHFDLTGVELKGGN